MQKILRYGTVILVLALLAGLCISIFMYTNMQSQYAQSREQLTEAVYQNLYMLTRKNEETTLAGADVQGTLLPAMREYFIAAKSLNETLLDAYGAKRAVLSDEQVAALESAFAMYDLAFRGGKSTGEAQTAMDACLQEIQALLNKRYESAGMWLLAS